jgi:hypothetical protein
MTINGVISTKDMDRGEALSGKARVDRENEIKARELAEIKEREFEAAVNAEVEKRVKAKSKRQTRGKKASKK